MLADVVRPAFATYRDVLINEVLPTGRPADRPGLSWLPGGDVAYAALVRVHTTTDRSPDELHQTGLDVIESLRAEYAELGGKVLGTDDLAEIFRRLRFDEALRWRTAEELLDAARAAISRASDAAPHWFGLQPATRARSGPSRRPTRRVRLPPTTCRRPWTAAAPASTTPTPTRSRSGSGTRRR